MAEKAKVDIEVKAKEEASAKLDKVGNRAEAMSKKFRKAGLAMTAVGAGLALAMGKLVSNYSEAGDEIAKMSKRTGWGTVALSELKHVAKITGTDIGSIEKATKKMSKSIIDADRGLGTYVQLFEELGLNVRDLRAQKPEEQFWTVANAIGDLEDHTLKAALAQEVFGKAGAELLPMLGETKESITSLRAEAHELNQVFSEESAKAAEDFEDAKVRLKESFQGIAMSIAENLMPHLEELMIKIKEVITGITTWIKEHPKLADALTKFGIALTALTLTGGPLLMMASYIPKLIAGFIALKTLLLTSVIPAVVKATLAFIAMLASMGPWGWAALLGGIAAAGAAVLQLTTMGMMGGGKKEWAPTPGRGGGETTIIRGQKPPEGFANWETAYEAGHRPSMQYGGIVPGRIGMPTPIIAHGGERFLGPGGGNMTPAISLTFNYQPMIGLGDESDMREAAERLRVYLREAELRTYKEID